MKFLIYVFIILLPCMVIAEDTNLTVCPKTQNQGDSLLEDINFLKTDKDKTRVSQGCIEINTTQTRENLFRKYLMRKYPGLKLSSTSDLMITSQCQVVIIKKILREAEKVRLGNNGGKLSAQELDQVNKAQNISQFSVMGGTETKVRVDYDNFKIKCTPTAKGFNIEFKSDSPQISMDTSLFVPPKQLYKIGTITTQDNKDGKNIAIINNEFQKKTGKRKYDLFIKVFE